MAVVARDFWCGFARMVYSESTQAYIEGAKDAWVWAAYQESDSRAYKFTEAAHETNQDCRA